MNEITPSAAPVNAGPSLRPWSQSLLIVAGCCGVFAAVGYLLPDQRAGAVSAASAGSMASAGPTVAELLRTLPEPLAGSAVAAAHSSAVQRLQRLPATAAAWTALGDALAQQQRISMDPAYFNHAETAYRQALNILEDHPPALAGMAWAYGGRHQFEVSVLWAGKALEISPDDPVPHGILGDAAVELGDYDRAFVHYQKMMDLRPDLSSLSRGAHLLWLTGNRSRGILLMQKAIASGGPFAENTDWCRARLAMMLFHDGALLPAEQALAPSLEAQPVANPHVLLAAGKLAAARGDSVKAVDFYLKAVAVQPSLEAWTALGDLAAVGWNQGQAEKYYQEVEKLHRQHRQTGGHDHMEMAQFYADHDRQLPEALKLALEHGEPRNGTAASTLAWVYFKNGDQPNAIKWIKVALGSKLPEASAHYHAGCIAAASGDVASAVNHLNKALSLNPYFSVIKAPAAVRLLEELAAVERGLPVTGRPELRSSAVSAGARGPGDDHGGSRAQGLLRLR